jgi:hypothetical protein
MAANTAWPDLPYDTLRPTLETLQLWTQIVGKMRLAQTPWVNHSWHVTLYLSARGLATGPIPHGTRSFDLELDLVAHALVVRVSDGGEARIALAPGSIAAFYAEVTRVLASLGVPVAIDAVRNELPNPIPFPRDTAMRAYDGDAAYRFWRALARCDHAAAAAPARK